MKVISKYPIVSLQKVTKKVDYGFTASATEFGDGPKFLRITDIQDDYVDWSTVPLCEADEKNQKKYALTEGDIVFARTGATTGKSYLIRECPEQAIFASYLIRVRPSEDIHPEYLSRFFQTPNYWNQINLSTSGTAQGGVNATKLKALQVPLPPIEEQRRIAAILDKADGVRRKRKEAIALTEELLRSAFLDMFGDPVTNPKGWEIISIGEIADVKTGKTPSREDSGNYGGNVRWVKTTEVKDQVICETEEHLTEKGASQMKVFPKDSILIAMYGQGATRGRTALLGCDCTTNQACAAILPSTAYSPMYLWSLLMLSYERLRELGRGGNQPNLNLSMVKDFEIPFPPIKFQNEFQNIFIKLNSEKTKLNKTVYENENLFNSLLQRAFRGEL